MAEPLPNNALDSALDPAEIVHHTFDHARRGFDQRQVQEYLRAVADALQDAQQREADMRTRLGKAIRRAESAEKDLRETALAHEASEVNRQVGDDVASVLDAAHATGEQRIAAAEKSSQKLMENAKAEAGKVRAAADAVLAERRAEAEAAAIEMLAEGRAEADAARVEARAEAKEMLAKAERQVLQARDEGDGLIREAEEARAQILEDMERRRRQARAQVERLRVGRDRLLRSYEVVRRTLEETTVELKSSLKEAKVRGDSAARAITNEPLAGREQLEAELADAKLVGLLKVTEPTTRSAAAELTSPALPRKLDPPQPQAPSTRPRVSEAMKRSAVPSSPKAPAVAPLLTPSSPDGAGSDTDDSIDAELAELEDDNLDVIELCDAIEEVIAMPAADAPAVPNELFAMLRQQSGEDEPSSATARAAVAGLDDPTPDSPSANTAKDKSAKPKSTKSSKAKSAKPKSAKTAKPTSTKQSIQATADRKKSKIAQAEAEDDGPTHEFPGIEAQRDAVIADAAKRLERRLKRALADEQNELLAGIRSTKRRQQVELTSIVGDVDMHISRYVIAINEVAAVTYGAGAALVDAEPGEGHLPAGAVEELLAADVVLPIRERLESLDALDVDAADDHLDPVRAFYRQRKTDHLGLAASRLANLLCVAGLCDALPHETTAPWVTTSK